MRYISRIKYEEATKVLAWAVVLNWNNAPDTLVCLASLEQACPAPHHVLVVDNGSTDDSVDVISEAYPGRGGRTRRPL